MTGRIAAVSVWVIATAIFLVPCLLIVLDLLDSPAPMGSRSGGRLLVLLCFGAVVIVPLKLAIGVLRWFERRR